MADRLGTVAIVRYSEVAVKGPLTRRRMERLLVEALGEALRRRGVPYEGIERTPGRILVWTREPGRAALAAARVFGVKSASPAVAYRFKDLADLVEAGRSELLEAVRGRVFRVRARRSGEHDFTSKDVERLLGAALAPEARGVDLELPEVTVYAEVRGDTVFFYTEIVEGPGGLPLGSEEPVLVLFSGGFDSTVASWLVMRRGAPAGLAFYSLGVEDAWRTALEAARKLGEDWVYWGGLRVYRVRFEPVAEIVRGTVRPGYVLLVLRRLMMEHACRLAESEGYEALATGESIGQVASQTVRNMRLIGAGLCLPVLRPLAGMDKDEVMGLAQRVGVYDIVARQVEQCRGSPVPRASVRVFRGELARAREALAGIMDMVEVERLEL